MKQSTCLAYQEIKVKEATRQRDLVTTLPKNTLIEITLHTVVGIRNWDWKDVQVLCIIRDFNYTTVRCQIAAFDTPEAYPYCRKLNKVIFALKLAEIKAWKPVTEKSLPLYMGWPIKYPLLTALLKGELPNETKTRKVSL